MACLLPLPEVSPGRRGRHVSRSPGPTLAKAPLPPKPVLSFWLTSHCGQISLTPIFALLFIGHTGFSWLPGLSLVMTSEGYSCFPVWRLTFCSPSFLYVFLPLLHRCLCPYFSHIPGAQQRPRTSALSYMWVERDWMKSRKGETSLGQTVWEDHTEEESLV